MEDNLKFFRMEDDLNLLVNERRTKFVQIQDDHNIRLNGREPPKTLTETTSIIPKIKEDLQNNDATFGFCFCKLCFKLVCSLWVNDAE